MGIPKPYHRICRQSINGGYSGANWGYILHEKYAQSPHQFINAFNLLQKDLLDLFDYVEPSDKNRNCYSFRIQELLLRTCVEIEANFKAILFENGYKKKRNLNINTDYRKLEISHKLSSYEVKLPYWQGTDDRRIPFSAWASHQSLNWYQAYNATKHDRHRSFEKASFTNLIDAICGLVVLLSSQFHTQDFSPADPALGLEGRGDGMESAIGEYFRIKFPNDWSEDQRYDFDWNSLRNEPEPFDSFDYSALDKPKS